MSARKCWTVAPFGGAQTQQSVVFKSGGDGEEGESQRVKFIQGVFGG